MISKKRRHKILWISCFTIFFSFIGLNSCKSSVQMAVEKQEAEMEQKQKEADKAYQEAVKSHQAKQSKTTRKMMKKSEKKRKKAVGKTIRKNRRTGNCTS